MQNGAASRRSVFRAAEDHTVDKNNFDRFLRKAGPCNAEIESVGGGRMCGKKDSFGPVEGYQVNIGSFYLSKVVIQG